MSTTSFTSTTEAYYEFLALKVHICNAVAVAVSGDMDARSPQPDKLNPDALYAYRMRFSHWERKFQSLIHSQNLHKSELEAILTLQIWAAVVRIQLYCRPMVDPRADLVYDEWHSTFQHIVTLSEQLYVVTIENARQTGLPHSSLLFSFGFSICAPLIYTVRCYDGGIRRRVIALLRKWPRRDGVLDPKLAAAVIEETMLYEESLAVNSKIAGADLCPCIPLKYVCGGHRVIRSGIRNIREGLSEFTLTTEIGLEQPNSGHQSGKKVLIAW